jgi:phosphocarrier protein
MLVSTALGFRSDLRVACEGSEVNGRSILALMTLQAGPGSVLSFAADGPDADSLLERLVALVEGGFEESS